MHDLKLSLQQCSSTETKKNTKYNIPYVAPMCSIAYEKGTPGRAQSLLIRPLDQVGLSGQCYNTVRFSFENSKSPSCTLTTQALLCHSRLSTLFDGEGSSTISQRTKSVSISLGRNHLSYSGTDTSGSLSDPSHLLAPSMHTCEPQRYRHIGSFTDVSKHVSVA